MDHWGKVKGTSRTPFPIYDHANTSHHHTKLNNSFIVGREVHAIARTIREAMFIRVNDLSLNSNIGKYQLPPIWDEVLFNSPDLHLKCTFLPRSIRPTVQGTQHQPTNQCKGAYTLCLQHQQLVGMGSCNITNLVSHILAPDASVYITSGAIHGKY